MSTFVPIGMTSITTKYFPRFRNHENGHHGFFGFMLLYGLIGFILVTCALLLFRDFFIHQYEKESKMFADYFNYVFPLTFFLSFFVLLQAYSYSLYKTTVPSFLNDVVARLGTVVVSGLYFIHVLTLDQFVFWFVGIYAIQFLLMAIYIFRADKPSFRIDVAKFRENQMPRMIYYGLLMSLAGVSSLGLKYLDSIMIGRVMPLKDVAIYSISAFLPTVIEAPLNALEKISASKLSNALQFNDMDEIRTIYYKSTRYLVLIGGFLFLGVNLNIQSLLSLVPRPEYQQGIYVVLIISISSLINMATGVNNTIIFSSDKYFKLGTVLLIFLFVMVLVFNLIFIPIFGIEGAALATALSSFLYNGLKYAVIWKYYGLQPFNIATVKSLGLLAVCFLAVFFIPHLHNAFVDIVLRSTIILLVYGFGTYALRIVPEFHRYLPWEKKKLNKS